MTHESSISGLKPFIVATSVNPDISGYGKYKVVETKDNELIILALTIGHRREI